MFGFTNAPPSVGVVGFAVVRAIECGDIDLGPAAAEEVADPSSSVVIRSRRLSRSGIRRLFDALCDVGVVVISVSSSPYSPGTSVGDRLLATGLIEENRRLVGLLFDAERGLVVMRVKSKRRLVVGSSSWSLVGSSS